MQWSSELNSPFPVHFSSLIPKVSMFTLAISCLTSPNLPQFMDLTFQVPMQYCSSQHQTLLPSPVPTTLVVVLALAQPWAPTNLGVHLSVSYLFAFSYCSWGSQGKILKWFAIPFSSGPRFVRTLHHDPSILGGSTQHCSKFHWVRVDSDPCDQFG